MDTLTGSCLCRAIRYEVRAAITELRACHCKDCQKSSGTGASVNAMIPSAALSLTQGTQKRYSVVAQSGRTLHRYFCGDCGSPLYSRRETVLDAPPMKIVTNIWTGSAQPWAHIDPQTKQFPGQPDYPPTRA